MRGCRRSAMTFKVGFSPSRDIWMKRMLVLLASQKLLKPVLWIPR